MPKEPGVSAPRAGRFSWFAESLVTPPGVSFAIAAFVLCWTLIGTVLTAPIGLHHDVTEGWVWGKEWQLGYAKHPPLLAWIVGAWFSVFPRTEPMFMALAAFNAGLGLAGVWAVSRRLVDARTAAVATLLLAVTPFFTIMALKLNANSIQLALWPWTAWAFMRSIESRNVVWAALFGLLGALALLGKYYSGLLLASCFLASLAHPTVRRYYLSPAPYVTGAVFALAIAPHVWWLASGAMPTLDYALDKTNHPLLAALSRAGGALIVSLAYLAPAVVLFAYAERWSGMHLVRAALQGATRRENLWITVLCVGPLLMTFLFVFAGVRISSQFLMPTFFLLPAAMLHHARHASREGELARAARGAGVATATAVLLAPALAVAAFAFDIEPRATETRREVAQMAQQMWRETYNRRLDIVAGAERWAHAVSFYSSDAPSEFSDLDPRAALWITPDRLAKSGLLYICEVGTKLCSSEARMGRAPDKVVEREIAARFLWLKKKPRKIRFAFYAPR